MGVPSLDDRQRYDVRRHHAHDLSRRGTVYGSVHAVVHLALRLAERQAHGEEQRPGLRAARSHLSHHLRGPK
jgi:hypothetical protein